MILFAGIMLGRVLPDSFFRPWYGHDHDLYRGDSVRFKGIREALNNDCKKRIVLDSVLIGGDRFAWVLLEQCKAEETDKDTFSLADTFFADELEKE
jgi:hypothetical protein